MGGPGEAGWDNAAARPPSSDCHLKGAGTVSCTTDCFHDQLAKGELTIESIPALYKKLGILGIELNAHYLHSYTDESLDAIIQAVHKDKRMLTALALDGSLVSDDLDANQRQIEEDKRMLRAARYLGAPVVCLSLGQTGQGDEADASVGVERAIVAIRALLPTARELGIRMTIENGPGPANTPQDIIKIIQGTDPLFVGLCFNYRNWANAAERLAAIQKLAPYVYHTHINGAAFDRMGDESSIDYAHVLLPLARAGYGTGLSIVFDGQGDVLDGVAKTRDLLVRFWVGKGTGARPALVAASH
jgi:sugar phosphate isomerase/epimerase